MLFEPIGEEDEKGDVPDTVSACAYTVLYLVALHVWWLPCGINGYKCNLTLRSSAKKQELHEWKHRGAVSKMTSFFATRAAEVMQSVL